jgi:SAM-dependent methyltransferase
MLCCFLGTGLIYAQIKPLLDVPYVSTSPAVVQGMLKLAQVKAGDVIYDLGCGDGRIVIAAVRDFHAIGTGFDLDPDRIADANENASRAGLSGRAKFVTADLFDVDLSKATVITLYLLPTVNMQLRAKLLALKPGTRIVSHAFGMGDWKPDKTEEIEHSTIYFWTVPKKNSN